MKRIILVLFSWMILLMSSPGNAALNQFFTQTGKISVSVDGAGSNNVSHTADVEKPSASATVSAAFVMASSAFGTSVISDGDITINGTPINWDDNININGFNNVRADVTSIVKPIMDAASAGRTSFTFTEKNTRRIDGETLVVVFNNPAQTDVRTASLFFGGQKSAGDSFAITLASPIDPAATGSIADFGLAIGFGFQGNMFSTVDVNGTRITSSAGGHDDGAPENGALISVGGLDDSNTNPADPNAHPSGDPRIDDELYTLLPIITSTTTSIKIDTANPSNDDDIYFSYLVLSGAAVVGEGILLEPPTATLNTGDNHTVTATVVDNSGKPVVGAKVTFSITSGPNAGKSFTATTDANGKASITYSSTVAGTDQIKASSPAVATDSNVISVEWKGNTPPPSTIPTLGEWGLFVLVLLLVMIGYGRKFARLD